MHRQEAGDAVADAAPEQKDVARRVGDKRQIAVELLLRTLSAISRMRWLERLA